MDIKIEAGFCQCGCGKPTNLAPCSDKGRGWTKGKPFRFIHGHNPAPKGDKHWKRKKRNTKCKTGFEVGE
jgi:hypothetical protein